MKVDSVTPSMRMPCEMSFLRWSLSTTSSILVALRVRAVSSDVLMLRREYRFTLRFST